MPIDASPVFGEFIYPNHPKVKYILSAYFSSLLSLVIWKLQYLISPTNKNNDSPSMKLYKVPWWSVRYEMPGV